MITSPVSITTILNFPQIFFLLKYIYRLQQEEGLGVAVYVQRDCNPPSDRDSYVKELMKYLPIDSYGPCLNNKQIPKNIDGFAKLSSHSYYQFLGKYKFQIAFENSLCRDYMTEKVFRPLYIGSVPVYFGSDAAQDFMPTNHSIIMVEDFESPKHLAQYLLELNKNDALYDEYLRHKKTKKIENHKLKEILKRQPWKLPHINHKYNFGSFMFSGFSCYVCDSVHERNNQLSEHLNDKKQQIMKPKIAHFSHMGCPIPVRTLKSSDGYPKQKAYQHGKKVAKALSLMLLTNETDSKTFQTKYLLNIS